MGIVRSLQCFGLIPLPVPYLRQVLAVLVDIELVLDQLVAHFLLQVGSLEPEFGTRSTTSWTTWKLSRSFCTRMSNAVVMVPSSL